MKLCSITLVLLAQVFSATSFALSNAGASRGWGSSNHDKSHLGMASSTLLITFDLDDTLFPIRPVVQDANEAQIAAMHELGYPAATLEACMVQTRAIRRSLTEPMTYTDLRKGAIRAELERLRSNNSEPLLLQQHVEHCFDAWLNERHAASERYLFPNAMAALEHLQTTFDDNNVALCLAGITNGRGNPLQMKDTLAPLFAFCVSGEDDRVFPHRKPSPQIYEAALEEWRAQQHHDSTRMMPTVWIHVGDCLANDVGASHAVGAKPIWVAPSTTSNNEQQPSWSTATPQEVQERKLLMEAARSKICGQITDLSQLNGVVQEIWKDWSDSETAKSESTRTVNRATK